MSAKKLRHPRRNQNNNSSGNHQLQHQNPSLSHINGPSDYESDTAYYSENFAAPLAAPPPARSNDELNLSVIQRHSPAVQSILSIAPYAVVYVFNSISSTWEKSGIEGSLFVSQLYPDPQLGYDRYSVLVLNRRGLDNFESELQQEGDVEITEEYVILKTQSPDDPGKERIIGLWIFSEPPPSSTSETRKINAQLIKQCAIQAGLDRQSAEEEFRAQQSLNGFSIPQQDHFPHTSQALQAANQMNDGRWPSPSFQNHTSFQGLQNPTSQTQFPQPTSHNPLSPSDFAGERRTYQTTPSRARQAQQGPQPVPPPHFQHANHQLLPSQQQSQAQQDVLGDLFRRAGLGFRGQ